MKWNEKSTMKLKLYGRIKKKKKKKKKKQLKPLTRGMESMYLTWTLEWLVGQVFNASVKYRGGQFRKVEETGVPGEKQPTFAKQTDKLAHTSNCPGRDSNLDREGHCDP